VSVWRARSGDDVRRFAALWRSFLVEQRSLGSEILPTPRTLLYFCRIARDYAEERGRQGIVLFYGEDAVHMAGEGPEIPFDTDLGRVAVGWGTYVAPHRRRQGIARELREEGWRLLAGFGFQTALGSSSTANPVSETACERAGMVRYNVSWRVDLRERAR
jgi:GNAT superfamily N-acetyltransferase